MIKVVLQLLIAVILFLGGIWLLALRIPGWGLFLGLPAVQIGIGKKTSTPIFVDGGLCPVCQRRKMKKPRKES